MEKKKSKYIANQSRQENYYPVNQVNVINFGVMMHEHITQFTTIRRVWRQIFYPLSFNQQMQNCKPVICFYLPPYYTLCTEYMTRSRSFGLRKLQIKRMLTPFVSVYVLKFKSTGGVYKLKSLRNKVYNATTQVRQCV